MSLDDYNIKRAHSAIDDLAEELAQAKKELADQKAMVCGKLLPVVDYPMGNCMASVSSYRSPEHARKEIEALYQKCQALKEANQAAVKNNETVYDGLRKLIAAIGIPSSYNKMVNRRSFKTESITYNWVDGLRSLIPMQDRWATVQDTYDRKMKEVADWEMQIAAAEETQRRIAEQDAKNQERDRLIGVLANKYDLSLSADENAVLEAILSRDKYLALGHSLRMNRGDWADGPDHAARGLDRFTVDNDIDIAIRDDISRYVENWDGDGRVFRDCKYNYDKLFEMADKSLVDDYRALTDGMDFS